MKLTDLTKDQLIASIKRTNKAHNRKLKALESAARVSLEHEGLRDAQIAELIIKTRALAARVEKAEATNRDTRQALHGCAMGADCCCCK